VVFPSTIAVFGPPYPALVDDRTWPVPALSYGAEKLMGEILLAEYTRRGWLRGRSVRLPSIVARPPIRTGAASAFSSELIRELASGRTYVCPVSPDATHWLMSRPCCVDNLLHAGQLPPTSFGPRLVLTLPAVHVSTRQLVEAIAERCGTDVLSRIRYAPSPSLEANFGSFPPLSTAQAEAAGFMSDANVEMLLERALATLAEYSV
jgi:nucleoside-diphosphate-sugar epimerase